MIVTADCVEHMATMEPESVDAIVTDPPYLLRFMGKTWDGPTALSGHATPDENTVGFYQAVGKGGRHDGGLDNWQPHWMQAWHERWAIEALRVAKPGAHLLAFGGTRTYHRLASAIEDAGWEIRDCLVWAYASGFPKSLNIGDGRGTALKPAWEPIVMARKPLRGTVAANVAQYGTGALNIDATRIGRALGDRTEYGRDHELPHANVTAALGAFEKVTPYEPNAAGRWPSNLLLTDPIFDGDTPGVVGGGEAPSGGRHFDGGEQKVSFAGTWRAEEGVGGALQTASPFHRDGDSGTYSRFFLIPKADRADREPLIRGDTERANTHPTVKPLELMRHLVRLVTPPGGLVLDPFLGSGTTGIAAEMEGFRWIGIEKEPEYVRIAEARLNGVQRGLGLSA